MSTTAAHTQRRRDDPRRQATRVALIEAAERLFADAGFAAVSTRQIGTAIGSLNTNVVAYHFGTKEGLIEAVFRHRLPEIDRRRGELLAQAVSLDETASLSSLLEAFALPLFEQTDADGQHTYARFLQALERSGQQASRALVSHEFPHTNRLTSQLAAFTPAQSAADGHTRIRLVTSLIATALLIIDQRPDLSPHAARALFDNALAMSVAAFCTAAPQGTLS